MFNHFQYLASLYVVAPLASCVALLVNRVPAAARRPARAGVTALLMVLDALSWNQSGRPRPRRTPLVRLSAPPRMPRSSRQRVDSAKMKLFLVFPCVVRPRISLRCL